jgi:hypothetical protein
MAAGGKRSNRIIIYIVLIVVLAAVLIFILVSRNNSTPTQQVANQPTPVPVGDMVNIFYRPECGGGKESQIQFGCKGAIDPKYDRGRANRFDDILSYSTRNDGLLHRN